VPKEKLKHRQKSPRRTGFLEGSGRGNHFERGEMDARALLFSKPPDADLTGTRCWMKEAINKVLTNLFIMEKSVSMVNMDFEPGKFRDLGELYEANYVIANEFGHRLIKSEEMAELMMNSSNPEEFQRSCDRAIAWAN
jgi:hypothetical protein